MHSGGWPASPVALSVASPGRYLREWPPGYHNARSGRSCPGIRWRCFRLLIPNVPRRFRSDFLQEPSRWSPGALAALVQQLPPYAGSQVLGALPPALAAKALGRLPPLQRPRVLKHVAVPQAAAIVQRLVPAVTVSLLGTLPEGFAQTLLDTLHPDEMALLQARWPQAAKVLAEAEDEVLAYMGFPHEHWTRIFSTNVLERLNREVKRRTEVVGVFPDIPSVIRLVGAVLIEIDDEWQVERRYFSLESMHKLTDPNRDVETSALPLRLAPVR